MGQRSRIMCSLLLWLLACGKALATTPPDKVVQQFVEAHMQGRFAAARSFTMERVNLSDSLFSGWIFGTRGAGNETGTADLFLSRQFVQTFRYNIINTTSSGTNQAIVTAVRSTPDLEHLYLWALAPRQGAAPYTLIEAIDTYLTKVNFPVEESRMAFTLIRETDEWYISAVQDEKFGQLRQQRLSTQPLSAALPLPGTNSTRPEIVPAPPPRATTTSDNLGRQAADAQFYATMQSFNRLYQPPTPSVPPQDRNEEKPSFFGRLANLFSFGSKKGSSLPQIADANVQRAFQTIRDAMARYAARNKSFPDSIEVYDWPSLRHLVERYGKNSLPVTEVEAGFRFVQYRLGIGGEDYTLLAELQEPQNGLERVEVTAYGIDHAK